jgi:heavy metal sensor kinase
MKSPSIRWKLTLWYGGVLAVVLVLFSTAVFLTMRHQLLERIDQGLAEELADVLYEVKRADKSKTLHEWLDRRFGRHEGFDFQITRPNGERFFVNQRLVDKSLPMPTSLLAESPQYESISLTSGDRWRTVNTSVAGPDGTLTVQVARSLADFDHEMRELLLVFMLTGPLTLLIALSGGYFLARRALRPVETMTQAARQISANRLSERIAVHNPNDELGELAQTLNRMIERLESSFTEMQRFTADAAHELRTPLAVIRNEAEVALRSPRSQEEYGRVLENLLEETIRLSNMADQLLFLCRQDAGLQPMVDATVAVEELLRDVVGNMRLVAEEKGVALSLNEIPPCKVRGDQRQLRQVFYNLLDNAIKYTPASGRVIVTATQTDGSLSIVVADTGVGIPPEHLPRVFDRFYRVDLSRTQDGSGAGLGLSICKSIIKALRGNISLESATGQGTKVHVVLPIHPS